MDSLTLSPFSKFYLQHKMEKKFLTLSVDPHHDSPISSKIHYNIILYLSQFPAAVAAARSKKKMKRKRNYFLIALKQFHISRI